MPLSKTPIRKGPYGCALGVAHRPPRRPLRLQPGRAHSAAPALLKSLQAAATVMPLNWPVAIFFCHSAGPVMWALVPPESTATVTGMSTTSNS